MQLSLFCLISSLLSLQVFFWLSRKNESRYNRYVKESSQLSAVTYSGFQTIESIKATGRENEFFSKWLGFHAKFLNSAQETALQASVARSIPTLLSIVNMAVILVVGGYSVMDGMMSVGMLVSYTIFFQYFFLPIQKIADSGTELQLMVSYFRSVYDVLDYPISKTESDEELTSDSTFSLTGKLEIKNLSFGYNKRAFPVLNNLSITISPGERVAFIGLSGSGKSTLAKLITGLFAPWSGSILFDNQLMDDLPKEVRTAGIGMVDQEIELFAGTVREVLTFWDERIPMEDVIEACRLAEIHDVISARPGGYDSLLTEGGNNFSGGQRQRLEIARALIKKPQILIMDEATSALDPETEHRIYNHVRKLGITLVIIAHRLSAIRDSDQIVVLNKGVIEHKGIHEELMVISPLYQEFLKQTQ
jgi:ABC-type bacteriocin/lantibiotic exporter with double-glycine peptidase domain